MPNIEMLGIDMIDSLRYADVTVNEQIIKENDAAGQSKLKMQNITSDSMNTRLNLHAYVKKNDSIYVHSSQLHLMKIHTQYKLNFG